MGDYEIRPFQDEDEASLLETFNLVFSATNPDMPPRTPEQWRWAYRENPGGKRIFVAAHEGQVVAPRPGGAESLRPDEQRSEAELEHAKGKQEE